MNSCRGGLFGSANLALIFLTAIFLQPCLAQTPEGKQQEAQAISSTRQALSGRLFFSSEQRVRLDRQRAAGEVVLEDEGVVTPSTTPGINGFVKRSDGETAVWIDGRANYRAGGTAADGMSPQDVGGELAMVRMLPAGNRSAKVKKIDRADAKAKSSAKIKPKKKPASPGRSRPGNQ